MTKDQAVQKLLLWVSEQIGVHEGANNYNKFAEDPRLIQLYGWNAQNQPWCDLFTDAAFINVFGLELGAAMTYQPIGGGSAACRTSAGFFREHGAFVQSPEPGDVVFFYARGDINHQGIVVRVYGGSIVTVEGNSSDQVAERVYQIGSADIAGYGRPKWELAEGAEDINVPSNETEEEPDDSTAGLPLLRNGMGGPWVAAMQGALVYKKCSLPTWGVDGDYGEETRTAVRNFQIRNGLAPDGICGAQTWAALMKM